WPTANPDRILLDRRNANAVDLNRQHITLSEPEARALAVVLGRTRPAIVVDMHEAFPQDEEVSFAAPTNPMASPVMVQHARDIITACKARATLEGWASGDYPPNTGGSERTLVNSAGLRHAAGVLVEVSQEGFSQDERITIATAMVEEIFAYAVANAATLISDADQSAADAAAAGAAGDEPFDLRTAVIDPPPLAYRITGVVPQFHLQVFGIQVQGPGVVVSMAQPAQPVIPFLFDPLSEVRVTTGQRLFSIPTPVVIATPQDYEPVVSGSHTLLTHVRLVTDFPTGYDPDGVDIPVRSGTVELDATADVFATLDLEIPGVDPATGRPWFPRRAVDPLAPYGAELFVRVGVDLGDHTLWSPLGYFRIDDLDQSDAPDGPIRISGSDRMAGVIDARLVEPMEFSRSATYAQVVTALVQDAHPLAVVAFDDDSGDRAIGRRLIVEEDRYEALRDLAESLGKLVWWDGEGILRVADAPDATVPVWHVRAGRHGVLVSAQRRVTRQGIYNAVVAQGEATSGTPARAVVVDDGPLSPTRWGGPFGKVPRFYSSPLLTTREQARAAAARSLRRSIGMPDSGSLGAVTNPALRPHDPIRVTLRDGSRDLHIVDTVSIPLTVEGGPMQLTTRSVTDVRL